MKTKLILGTIGIVIAGAIALHIGHEPPKDGKCPLQSAIAPGK